MSEHASYTRACRLFEAGRYDEAGQLLQACLQNDPGNPDVLNALGCLCDATGHLEAAAEYLRQAVRRRPDAAVFHFNYANVVRRSGGRETAEQEYLEAVGRDPSFAAAFHGLGSLYLEDDRLEPAEVCLQRAVHLAGDFVQALYDLGQLRQRQGRAEDAERLYRQCLCADSGYLPALNALGMLVLQKNRLGEARDCFRQALERSADYLPARCNLAVLDTWCGDLDAAISGLQHAVRAAPDDGDIHYNLALALLAAGRFSEGWREYEWRFHKTNPVPLRHTDIPFWHGESLDGRRILLHAEQGYGDSLQFIRYATLLAQQGATVFVEGQDRLVSPLLASTPGVFQAFSRDEPRPPCELQLPLLSLPVMLDPAAWPPPAPPYLNPSREKRQCWQARLAALPGLKVGLAWAGRTEHANDANRSIQADLLTPLAQPGVTLISLQFGDARAAAGLCPLYDFRDEVHDFTDSAALVAELDLVITVDSAVAHLAGGLGVPVWLLLPWNPDWRWMHGRDDSLWYPSTRIYRQVTPGQWHDVIRGVAGALAGKAACSSPQRADGSSQDVVSGSTNGMQQLDLAAAMPERADDVVEEWAAASRVLQDNPYDMQAWRILAGLLLHEPTLLAECFVPAEAFATALGHGAEHLEELSAMGRFFLLQDPSLTRMLVAGATLNDLDGLLLSDGLDDVLRNTILIALCERSIISDIKLEGLLTNVRRALLIKADDLDFRRALSGDYLAFVCALAIACFRNEYVFWETEDELVRYRQLMSSTLHGPEAFTEHPGLCALLGAYQPLYRLAFADKLSQDGAAVYRRCLAEMLRIQIFEPLLEKQLAETIPVLGQITHPTSLLVRRQYEENPYPRWDRLRLPPSRPLQDVLKGIASHVRLSRELDLAHPAILVAGCGTGQHPIYTAVRFSGARVLAIDLSRASLAYAMRKALEMKCAELTFMQADILSLQSLGQQFDLIECGGVLHHLKDPKEGLASLLKLLKPGGLMGIALYSRLGRRSLEQARQLLPATQGASLPQQIRGLRKAVCDAGLAEPGSPLGLNRDFFTMSGCRDLLLHVQEHQFDLPQIAALLDEHGLEFAGFQLPASVRQNYRARFPEDSSSTDLHRWAVFESEHPDTFRAMYQFYAVKRQNG